MKKFLVLCKWKVTFQCKQIKTVCSCTSRTVKTSENKQKLHQGLVNNLLNVSKLITEWNRENCHTQKNGVWSSHLTSQENGFEALKTRFPVKYHS